VGSKQVYQFQAVAASTGLVRREGKTWRRSPSNDMQFGVDNGGDLDLVIGGYNGS
jgi:hypothetical protein